MSGRSYPVEVRYRPLAGDDEEAELSLTEGIVAAVRELDREDRGDVLVFLPGEKQIREAAEALGKAQIPSHRGAAALCAPVDARAGADLREARPRRIVLATNVAETSLTVPGIRHVVDCGLARISRYSVRGKVQRLPIEPISQASADQRKGRAGRESAGICIRLYAEDDFVARPAFTPPEVLRTNLASVILQMAALELGEPRGVSVRRSARHAHDQRRLSAAAGAEGRRRSANGDQPRPADLQRCRSIRAWRACCSRRATTMPVRDAGDRRVPGRTGSARAAGRMRRRRPTRSTRNSPIRARTSSPC